MLKQRLIAALILIPLVVWGVLKLPTPAFALITAVIILLAAWEWTQLIPLPPRPLQVAFVLLAAVLIYALWSSGFYQDERITRVLFAALTWWLAVPVWMSFARWSVDQRLLKGLVAVPVLVPAWLGLIDLHARPETGGYWVLYLLVLIWIADSAAYFTGKAWGRHKLAPSISPGKTWEGVLGGMTGSAVFAVIVSLFPDWSLWQRGQFILLALLTAAISVVGDLFISLLKRQVGVKDSSHLIPGHGGVLDRIDSLLAGAPIFILGALQAGLI